MRGELNIRNGVAKVMPYCPVWSVVSASQSLTVRSTKKREKNPGAKRLGQEDALRQQALFWML